jgi:hypothetical protein
LLSDVRNSPYSVQNAAAPTRSRSAGLVVLDVSFEPRWSLAVAIAADAARPITCSARANPISRTRPPQAGQPLIRSKQLRHVRVGSFLTELGCPRHVRFTPGSDRGADIPVRQLRANTRSRRSLDDFTSGVSHSTSVDLISADETGIIHASTARTDCEAARGAHSGMPAIRQACDNLSISSALRNFVLILEI